MTFSLIDVSHHQSPSALDWAGMKSAGCDGVIVRLTYGLKHDTRAGEHIARARDAGLVIGGYHFARCSQPVGDQIDAFGTAARLAGYGLPEDLLPVLDCEDDTSARPIGPENAEAFATMATLLELSFGHKPYCYITARDWTRLGKPAFVLSLPLHVAHYAAPSRVEPATPNGIAWELWQHRVADFDINGPSGYYKDAKLPLDQNRARRLRFLNGQVFDSPGTIDEALPEQRHDEDTDGTHERRTRMLEMSLAAEAGAIVSDTYYDMLESARKSAHDELTGHDTEPPSDTAETDRPPPESQS